MDIRYGANQNDAKYYDTEELRAEFLISDLFPQDDISFTYSHIDRIIVAGCVPVKTSVALEKGVDCQKSLGVDYFLERRELGIINIGGSGVVTADGVDYPMERLFALYIGKESKNVAFRSTDPKHPAKFYITSAPAHTKYPTTLIDMEKARKRELGDALTCNKRTINQLIHPDILQTCQLTMGCTQLAPGSVWNTMPCHTHERRMEVYLYFDIPADNVVFHYMGEGNETRHIVMQNEQAVISPSWSIHSGCGTASYTFIWAMVGENQTFDDMDHIKTTDLR